MPTNEELPVLDSPVDQKLYEKTNSKLISSVTFFGDAALDEGHEVYKAVWAAAKLLAENGYAIVNGGGPGVMKAATDGAESVNGHTVAVYWQPKLAAYFEGRNLANVTDESESASNYMMRTLGLIERGDAYVVCRGGTGTLSEFGMVWALAKLYYGCHKPVILYGDFWEDFIQSIQDSMYIDEIEVGVLYRASTPEDILRILKEHELKISHCQIRQTDGDESGFLVGGRLKEVNYNGSAVIKPDVTDPTTKAYDSIASDYHQDRVGKLPSEKQLEEFCRFVNTPAKILDVGSGPGYDAKYLSQKYSVVAVEKSRRFVEISKYENPEIEVYNSDIVDFPLTTNTYKGIWARDSLHHIEPEKLPGLFTKFSDSLVEDGILYVIVREGVNSGMETKGSGENKHTVFVNEFTVEELTKYAVDAGFVLEKIEKSERSHKWLIGVFRKKALVN